MHLLKVLCAFTLGAQTHPTFKLEEFVNVRIYSSKALAKPSKEVCLECYRSTKQYGLYLCKYTRKSKVSSQPRCVASLLEKVRLLCTCKPKLVFGMALPRQLLLALEGERDFLYCEKNVKSVGVVSGATTHSSSQLRAQVPQCYKR